MQVKQLKVQVCDRSDITAFIEQWHYSKSINGCISDYCFKLEHEGVIVGAMFYGRMAMAGQWRKYGTDAGDVIELRRLCCIDAAPKNTESYFIGATLRWLKRNTRIKTVVSYADAEHGHIGTIYKASNFRLQGFTKGARVIMHNGKRYHDKTVRTKYKGELKPFAKRIALALETGDATYQNTAGKYCYVYTLR